MHLVTEKRRFGVSALALTALVVGCSNSSNPQAPGGPFLPTAGSTATPVSTATGAATSSPVRGGSSPTAAATSVGVATATPTGVVTSMPSSAASAVANATPVGTSTAKPTASPVATPASTASPAATPVPTTTPATPTPTASSPTVTSSGNIMCTAPNETAGTYVANISIAGNVANSTFTGDPNQSSFVDYTLVPATPTPTPPPTPTPGPATPTPTPFPSFTPAPAQSITPTYTYVGEFTASAPHPTTGCVFLTTTQSGAPPFQGDPYNGQFLGFIDFDQTMYSVQTSPPPTRGTVTSLSVSNLGASSGAGTFTLSDGTTGTIVITGRVSIQDEIRMRAEIQRRRAAFGR